MTLSQPPQSQPDPPADLPMAGPEDAASPWLGGCLLLTLGGCLLLCGLCQRKLPVSPTAGPQPRDSLVELGSRYMSDPTAGTSVATSPRPPVGPCSTDNEDDDDFQYPPAPWTEALQTPVFEPLKSARESGTDVDSHGSYVNIHSEEDYVNLEGAEGASSVEKDKEYLELLPSPTQRPRPQRQKGPGHKEGSPDARQPDCVYVNVP